MKRFLYLALTMVTLLGCSLFSNLVSAPSESEWQPNEEGPSQDLSTEGWLLGDPTAGLAALESYHQQLTVGFRGARDGEAYEWSSAYQRDVWLKQSADFTLLTTNETGLEPYERLLGVVGQAQYLRPGLGETCEVRWDEAASDGESILNPASFIPPVEQATDAGLETVNNVPARHYVINVEKSRGTVTGEYWLAEPGGYVVRYLLTISGGEDVFGKGRQGEQRFEYELSQVNAHGEVVYPEGCAPVLLDFPVMDGARNLHRLPALVDYTVATESPTISQFYQEQLGAQGWSFVTAHDRDPKNVVLVFANKDEKLSATVLLSAREKGVWVSASLRPWEPGSGEEFVP